MKECCTQVMMFLEKICSQCIFNLYGGCNLFFSWALQLYRKGKFKHGNSELWLCYNEMKLLLQSGLCKHLMDKYGVGLFFQKWSPLILAFQTCYGIVPLWPLCFDALYLCISANIFISNFKLYHVVSSYVAPTNGTACLLQLPW